MSSEGILEGLNVNFGSPAGRHDATRAIEKIVEVIENGEVPEAKGEETDENLQALIEQVGGIEKQLDIQIESMEGRLDEMEEKLEDLEKKQIAAKMDSKNADKKYGPSKLDEEAEQDKSE